MDGKVTANKWFLPLVWASKIITEGLAEGKIRPQCVSTLMSELCKVNFFSMDSFCCKYVAICICCIFIILCYQG